MLNEKVATKLLSFEATQSTKVNIDTNDTEKLEYEYLKQKDIILKENEAQIKAQEKKRRKIPREIFDIEEEIEKQRDDNYN